MESYLVGLESNRYICKGTKRWRATWLGWRVIGTSVKVPRGGELPGWAGQPQPWPGEAGEAGADA